MQLLGVCGSLRGSSTNARLLEAATRLLPDEVDLHLTTLVGRLPLFNPDISIESSDVVMQWIQEMRSADGLIISTPEYARGYPGALKNALDWLVDTDAFVAKPFIMLSASARSTIGRDTLITVVETMSGVHVVEASITVNLLGTQTDVASIINSSEHAPRIAIAIGQLVSVIRARTNDQR